MDSNENPSDEGLGKLIAFVILLSLLISLFGAIAITLLIEVYRGC